MTLINESTRLTNKRHVMGDLWVYSALINEEFSTFILVVTLTRVGTQSIPRFPHFTTSEHTQLSLHTNSFSRMQMAICVCAAKDILSLSKLTMGTGKTSGTSTYASLSSGFITNK